MIDIDFHISGSIGFETGTTFFSMFVAVVDADSTIRGLGGGVLGELGSGSNVSVGDKERSSIDDIVLECETVVFVFVVFVVFVVLEAVVDIDSFLE